MWRGRVLADGPREAIRHMNKEQLHTLKELAEKVRALRGYL